jgi:hypothetical protein
MSDTSVPCEYVIDVYGLRAICTLPKSQKDKIIAMLAEGRIRLLARVWQDFTEIFPELEGEFEVETLHKISMNDAYRECAAIIAEQADSGFAPRPYDSCSDWFTVSVGHLEGYVVVTGPDNLDFYNRLEACETILVSDI